MIYKNIEAYIGNIENLSCEVVGDKEYSSPNFLNAGSVSIVRVLEVIAPTVFRNTDTDITSASLKDTDVVCGKPNKTKHVDKSKGLRILRSLGVGGNYPQNRHSVKKDLFLDNVDINSLVFGDGFVCDGNVIPVKSAFLYSDILSFSDYDDSVSSTTHINSGEREYYNFEKGENSKHLFERNVINPGVIMVQVLTTNGKVATKEMFDHLLLSIDEAGAYGGQTSVSGTNIKNHIVGIYGSKTEKAITSPYELVKHIRNSVDDHFDLNAIKNSIVEIMNNHYESQGIITESEVNAYREQLISEYILDDREMASKYDHIKKYVNEYFSTYISDKKKSKK